MGIGDRVQLISGGPIMTLGEVNAQGKGICYWFHEYEVKVFVFNISLLKKPLG